jgi:hypothetical protein
MSDNVIIIGTSIQSVVSSECVSLTPAPITTLRMIDLRSGKLPAGVTFKRSSIGSRINGAGQVAVEPVDAPRWDYDPDKARTNYALNSEFAGWLPGSPGNTPGGLWSGSTASGLIRETLAVGEDEFGRYTTFRLSGTNGSASISYLHLKLTTSTPAVSGQVWTGSYYIEMLAGSWAGIGGNPFAQTYQSTNNIANQPTGTPVADGLATLTFPVPSNAVRLDFGILMQIASGATVDATFRIRKPQLEIAAARSAYIKTYGAIGSAIDVMGGLLIEPPRTNLIPNNSASGAVLGTPGTNPTTWAVSSPPVAQSIVGVGVQNGIEYIDYRFQGTPAAATAWNLQFENVGIALVGDMMAVSCYLAIVAGSWSNMNSLVYRTSSGDSAAGAFVPNANFIRYARVATLSVVSPRALIRFVPSAAGLPVDFTLRVGLPQREQATASSSVIKTTNNPVLRADDVLTVDWGLRGIRDGVSTIRYTFDDETTQDVSTTIVGGKAIVPTNLRRARLRQITPIA